jgi:hypothetical protein
VHTCRRKEPTFTSPGISKTASESGLKAELRSVFPRKQGQRQQGALFSGPERVYGLLSSPVRQERARPSLLAASHRTQR